jgi:hypothetical protein
MDAPSSTPNDCLLNSWLGPPPPPPPPLPPSQVGYCYTLRVVVYHGANHLRPVLFLCFARVQQ